MINQQVIVCIIFIVTLNLVKKIHCDNNFVVVRQNNNYYCLTNEKYGLSWISDDIVNDKYSLFIPNIQNNEIKITSNNMSIPYSKQWNFKKTISQNLILDRRWEDLPTIKTNSLNKFKLALASNFSKDFTIPFSLRIERNAHIFLCDSGNINSSNCYWFQINAFENKKTSIHKCKNVSLPFISTKRVHHYDYGCTKNLNYIHKLFYKLNLTKWLHFEIEKIHYVFNLFEIDAFNKKQTILHFLDHQDIIDVKFMIINSDDVEGFWKIHEVNYLHTTDEIHNQILLANIPITDGTACISMFVSMCQNCSMTISLKTTDLVYTIESREFTQTTQNGQEIKEVFYNITRDTVLWTISTQLLTKSENKFWAINNIRTCHMDEFRIIFSNNSGICQLTTLSNQNVISHVNNINLANNCSEKEMNNFCIPLRYMGIENENLEVYGFSKNQSICPCSKNFYNSHCIYPEKVNNLMAAILHSKSILLSWEAPRTNCKFLTYTIEFQQQSYLACNTTHNFFQHKRVTKNLTIIITNLNSYSKYKFIVYTNNGYFSSNPVTLLVSTPSADTFFGNIFQIQQILPTPTSAMIYFKPIDCTKIGGFLTAEIFSHCTNLWCTTERKKQNCDYDNCSIINLIPFSNYEITTNFFFNYKIVAKLNATFQTKPSIPNKVEELEAYSRNETSISLRWKAPYPPYGEVEKYYIWKEDFSIFQYTINPSCNLWPDYVCATITDLQKNQYYKIYVLAKNKNVILLGEKSLLLAHTDIDAPGPPYDVKLHWMLENNLELEWKHPKTNGDITHFYIFLNSNETSSELKFIVKKYSLIYRQSINAKQFQTSTDYQILITSCNNDICGQNISVATYSPPDIPSFEKKPKFFRFGNFISVEINTEILNRSLKNSYNLVIRIMDVAKKGMEKNLDYISSSIFTTIYECNLSIPAVFNLTIGYYNETYSECKRIENFKLQKNVTYNIVAILVSTFRDLSRITIYSFTGYLSNMSSTESRMVKTTSTEQSESTVNFSNMTITTEQIVTVEQAVTITEDFYKTTTKIKKHNDTNTLQENVDNLWLLVLISVIWPIFLILIISIVWKFCKYWKKRNQRLTTNEVEEIFLREYLRDLNAETYQYTTKAVKIQEFINFIKNSSNYNEIIKDHNNILIYSSKKIYEKVKGTSSYEYIDLHINEKCYPKAYHVKEMDEIEEFYKFWKIIWEENIQRIVYIDNKEYKLWPQKNSSIKYGDFTIRSLSSKILTEYKEKIIELNYKKEKRKLKFLIFTSWPLENIPNSTLQIARFIRKAAEYSLTLGSPMLILTGLSMEEAGFILLCDICFKVAKITNCIDVPKYAQILANCNINLIKNSEYYIFANLILAELCSTTCFGINCRTLDNSQSILANNNEIIEHFSHVENMIWLNKKVATLKENRINYEYINTPKFLNIDIFTRSKRKFAITKQPREFSLIHFWEVVIKEKINNILFFNKNSNNNFYWFPDEQHVFLHLAENFTIKYQKTEKFNNYDKLSVVVQKEKKQIHLEILLSKISLGNSNPEDLEEFIRFYMNFKKITDNILSTLVTCCDGQKSSLFITFFYIIEKFHLEGVLDICSSVRLIRSYDSEFIKDLDQFEFLWKAAEIFLKENSLYEII